MTAHAAMMANAIRALSMDAVEAANSGHPGMPMGIADVATTLFSNHMRIDPSNPTWPDRDRFVLSAGHGSMLIYAIHHLLGYADMDMEQLRNFRQMGYRTAGHPEYGYADGIETTTGPLGQGLATAVGMAIAEQMMAARFGQELVDHYTYVIMGDGCLMEGISHESIDMAGHMRLGKLIALWDDNSISIDGDTDLSTSTDQQARFTAAGWHVQAVDGHDMGAIDAAITAAKQDPRPSMIACKTVIGYGADSKAGTAKAHGAPLGDAEIAFARKKLDWPHAPFEIPAEVYTGWREISAKGCETRLAWEARLEASEHHEAFKTAMSGEMGTALTEALNTLKEKLSSEASSPATRKASEIALEVINGATNLTVGGSADLTGSNNTRTSQTLPISADDFSGRYVFYGVREHAMAAAMNGMALHGGVVPYGGTFLVFADYLRPALRLSALMQQRVVYVLTHDSIGLGEDGPTHQPVETIPSLRVIPNVLVFRPCDAIETAEAWECALQASKSPSVLALTRQGLPTLRTEHTTENRVALGGYVLHEPSKARNITLLATGSEVSLALQAAQNLEKDGIQAAVVSMPCWELFDQQSEAYRVKVLGNAPRLAVEAALEQGWSKYTGNSEHFVGMDSFGASAPANELFAHFGITSSAVVEKAKAILSNKV